MNSSSIAAMRVAHFGKILNGFAILGVVLCAASIAYFLLLVVYYLLLVAVLLGTLFLILVEYPEFMNLFTNTEVINDAVAKFTTTYVPIIAPVTCVISALSIAALALSKRKDATARLAISIVCLIVSLIFTVIFTFMGGGNA